MLYALLSIPLNGFPDYLFTLHLAAKEFTFNSIEWILRWRAFPTVAGGVLYTFNSIEWIRTSS